MNLALSPSAGIRGMRYEDAHAEGEIPDSFSETTLLCKGADGA